MELLWLIPIIFVLYIVLLDYLSKRAYTYEKKAHRKSPANFNIPFKEVRIPAKDNGELYGWWIPAKPEMPTLLLIHGWSRNVERVLPYIRYLHPLGYNLLAIDVRNHGSSSAIEAPTVGTFTEDAFAAINYLVEQNPSITLGLIGLSLGGGASIAAAGQDKRIQATITVGAISHPVALMKEHFAQRNIPNFLVASLFLYMRLRFGIDYERIAPVNHIPNADGKLLIVHGENDETVPLAQGHQLAAANSTHARLWVVPAKGHSDCHLHPEFWSHVDEFLAKTLK